MLKYLLVFFAGLVVIQGCLSKPPQNNSSTETSVKLTKEKNQNWLQENISKLLKANYEREFQTTSDALEVFAKNHKSILSEAIETYSDFYRGTSQVQLDLDNQSVARVLMYLAGRCGYDDIIKKYFNRTCHFSVLYALADSKGVSLYYDFTEGGCYDQIVKPQEAREIINKSLLFQYP